MLLEERRRTRFRIMMKGLEESDLEERSFHRFARPIELNRDSLRKLSPAHDPERTFLVVDVGNVRPTITGIRLHPPLDTLYGNFIIESSIVGGLRFGWLDFNLASYEAGRFEGIADVVMPADNLAANVNSFLGSDSPWFGMIYHLVPEIRRHGHGGSVWIVEAKSTLHPSVEIGYEVTDSPPMIRNGPHEWPESIARLSAIDGAVVLDRETALLGFGAFVPLDVGMHVARHVSFHDSVRVPVGQLGGGRHRSAATFCNRHHRSIAIVVSEDRGVSFMYRPDDGEPHVMRVSDLG